VAATGHERAPGPLMTGEVPSLGAWLEWAVARGGGVDPSRRTLGRDLDSHRLRGRAGLVAQHNGVLPHRTDSCPHRARYGS